MMDIVQAPDSVSVIRVVHDTARVAMHGTTLVAAFDQAGERWRSIAGMFNFLAGAGVTLLTTFGLEAHREGKRRQERRHRVTTRVRHDVSRLKLLVELLGKRARNLPFPPYIYRAARQLARNEVRVQDDVFAFRNARLQDKVLAWYVMAIGRFADIKRLEALDTEEERALHPHRAELRRGRFLEELGAIAHEGARILAWSQNENVEPSEVELPPWLKRLVDS